MADTGSNWISSIQWDASGKPYRIYLMDGPGYKAGDRQYVPPAEAVVSDDPKLRAWGDANKAPGQSFLKTRGTWDSKEGEWDRGINWTNILSAAVGGGIGAGALNALGVIGGAGGGGGSATSFGAPYVASNSAASMAGGASVPIGAVAPATAGAGASAGAGLGSKVAGWLGDHATDLAAIGIPAAAAALSGGGGGSNELPEELKRILAMAEARTRRSDPLHQAAVQMAFGALPTYGRQGISLPKVELP